MFVDRFAKGTSEQYYFQIAPNYLNVKSSMTVRTLKTKDVSYKLKLLKGKYLFDNRNTKG